MPHIPRRPAASGGRRCEPVWRSTTILTVRHQGTVVDVVQRGYRLGEKVVRPARVIVAE